MRDAGMGAGHDVTEWSHLVSSMAQMIKSEMRWERYVACMGTKRNSHRALVGKPQGRPRSKWEDNIKTDLRKVG
jgi:hypothetical protein